MVRIRFLVFFLIGMMGVASPVWSEVSIGTLKKGVVKVTAQFTQSQKVGTGFIVGQSQKNLFIVTASHVVEGEIEVPQSITVTFLTRQEEPLVAQVVKKEGGDPRGLALLKVGGDVPWDDVQILEWDTQTRLQGGEEFQLIGFPRVSGNPWAVTTGIFSGFEGQVLKFSGVVEEGSSGGPLLYQGKVIGVAMEVVRKFGNAKPAEIAKFTLDNWLVVNESNRGKDNQGRDDAPMVLISAGEFLMGSVRMEAGEDEKPQRSIFLNAFSIDLYEVTVEQYYRFVQATGQQIPKYWDQVIDEVSRAQFGTKPVVGVSWFDAFAYCKWVGKRLPTEAEWEKAARGVDGRIFPWGNDAPGKKSANFHQKLTELVYAELLTPAGTFERGRSVDGLFDMAGNVWEWVNDWYSQDYYRMGPLKNPRGPSQGFVKVLRGGSWKSKPKHLRTENRRDFSPNRREPDLGFRCARNAS